MLALSILTGVLALILSSVVGHQATAIGRAFGLVDRPDPAGGRKLHAKPTPLVGGLAVALSVVGAAMVSQLASNFSSAALAAHFGWIGFAMAVMYLIGAGDDRHQLSPRLRLLLSTLTLATVLFFDGNFILTALRFTGWPAVPLLAWGSLFTIVCLIGLINAVNMADGKNGLVIGLCLIWGLVLLSYAPPHLWPVLAAAIAALAVTMWFNLHGRLFLGDGGSYGLSVLFGLLAIDIYNQPGSAFRAELVALLFVVPVLDTIRLMTLRVAIGKSPFDGDRNHLHHFLADKFGWPEGLIVYLGLVGGTNLVAHFIPGSGIACLAAAAAGYLALLLICRRPAVSAA